MSGEKRGRFLIAIKSGGLRVLVDCGRVVAVAVTGERPEGWELAAWANRSKANKPSDAGIRSAVHFR